MKQTLTLLAAAASALVFSQAARAIEVVELPVPTDPTVAFRIMFKSGSQDDPAGKEGLASLTAQMISDGGTTVNTYEQILKKQYPMATGYFVSLDKEMTVVSGRVHKDNVAGFTDLLVQAITQPAFAQADFDRIKTDAINYLDRTLRYSNDEAFGKQILYDEIFAGTPYGHPDAGLPASVSTITLDDVKNFYKTHYTAGNCVIGIGGSYSPDLVTRLKAELGKLSPTAPAPIAKPTPKMPDGIDVVLVDKDTKSTAISIGYPFDLLRGQRDFYALWIADSWLGEHRNSSSHLYQVIREKRGMNYGDYSYIEYYPNGWRSSVPPPNTGRRQQFFEIWLRPVPNKDAHFALRAAIREVQKLVDNGMTQDEFDLTRKFLKKYVHHYAPTTDLRLGYRLDDAFYGIPDHLETAGKMFDQMTLADANAAVKKYIQTQNLKIAMITTNAAALKDALVNNTPSPMVYENPKGPEIMEEDKSIEAYPLKISAAKVTIVPVDSTFMK